MHNKFVYGNHVVVFITSILLFGHVNVQPCNCFVTEVETLLYTQYEKKEKFWSDVIFVFFFFNLEKNLGMLYKHVTLMFS